MPPYHRAWAHATHARYLCPASARSYLVKTEVSNDGRQLCPCWLLETSCYTRTRELLFLDLWRKFPHIYLSVPVLEEPKTLLLRTLQKSSSHTWFISGSVDETLGKEQLGEMLLECVFVQCFFVTLGEETRFKNLCLTKKFGPDSGGVSANL